MSAERLVRMFKHRFIRQLSRLARVEIKFFYALEYGSATGAVVHLHALVEGTAGLTTDAIRSEWPLGHTHVAVYDRSRHAALYVSKGILLDSDSYDVSTRWPPMLAGADQAADERFLARIEERAVR